MSDPSASDSPRGAFNPAPYQPAEPWRPPSALGQPATGAAAYAGDIPVGQPVTPEDINPYRGQKLRHAAWKLLDPSLIETWWERALITLIALAIVGTVVVQALLSVETVVAQHGPLLQTIDRAIMAFFMIEYLARLWAAPEIPHRRYGHPVWGRLRWAIRPLSLIDLLAWLPLILEPILGVTLSYLRVLRVLAFFKLMRASTGVATIFAVIKAEAKPLFAAFLAMVGVLVLSGFVIYEMEHDAQPEQFPDVVVSLWWSLLTLTGVGFEGTEPVTGPGRSFAVLVLLFGVMFYALPAAILASGFSTEMNRRQREVTTATLQRFRVFDRLPVPQLEALVPLFEARQLPAGHTIMRRTDPVEGMYMILRGRVRMTDMRRTVELREGTVFGQGTAGWEVIDRVVVRTVEPCIIFLLRNEFQEEALDAAPDLRLRLARVPSPFGDDPATTPTLAQLAEQAARTADADASRPA